MQASVSVITVGELSLGVLSARDPDARGRRAETLRVARSMDPVPINEWVMEEWARLVKACRDSGVASSVKKLDSLIAATAITLGVPVVTQDDDFDQIASAHPALEVVHV